MSLPVLGTNLIHEVLFYSWLLEISPVSCQINGYNLKNSRKFQHPYHSLLFTNEMFHSYNTLQICHHLSAAG